MAFKVHGISRAALARLGITARYGLPQVLRPLPLVVGLFCLETALFFMFATRLLDMRAYLTLHFALCVTTAMFGRRWIGAASAAGDGSDQIARVLQLAGWTTLAGPFGTLVATAL